MHWLSKGKGGLRMAQEALLKLLEQAVTDRTPSLIDQFVKEAHSISMQVETDTVLTALCRGLDEVRQKFNAHQVSMPEFLLSVDVLTYAIKALDLVDVRNASDNPKGRIVIGVVEGDVHDLGKNIVAGVLTAYGYEVIDLGRDVPARTFVEEVKARNASLLALSCMMSTPLEHMKETINRSRDEIPGIPILVGGAVLDAELAAAIGADGYADSAGNVPEEVARVLGCRT